MAPSAIQVLDPVEADRLPPVDLHDCPACEGRGEVFTGNRDWLSGAYETATCGRCGGYGEVAFW